MTSTFWVTVCTIAALVVFFSYQSSSLKRRRLPPGPTPLPFLGNIRDLPPEGALEYEHWLKHKGVYGPVSSVTVMGMTLIIIHDRDIAHELLDQQSSKTSGRPTMVMANELCGYGNITLCQSYTSNFRGYRKMLHRELGTMKAAEQFRALQEIEVGRQLVRGLREPEKWLEHLKTTAAATVLQMAYGYRVEPLGVDLLVETIEQMMKEFSLAAVPMTWAPDIIPALRYLPDGFPGASFQATARKWRRTIEASAYTPYQFVREQMSQGTNPPSYVSKLFKQLRGEAQDGQMTAEDEEAIIWTAASLYGAAADTTVVSLTAFTLAMLRYPSVQQKAQQEIDAVVGRSRLPTFKDREKLPYVNALVKEVSRWWPIAPMSFPHTVTETFEWRDFTIPKDAFLLPNVHWLLHDDKVYRDPDQFQPERFLDPRNEPDPVTEAFGYGRRICPGRFFADAALYINIVQTLACFSIRKALDENGEEISVDHVRPTPGILTYPTPFDFRVEPRSEDHVRIIQKFEREHPWQKGDSALLGHKLRQQI